VQRIGLVGLGLFVIVFSGPAAARNDVFHLPFAGIIDRPDVVAHLGATKFIFGSAPATGYQAVGDHVAQQRGHFHGRGEGDTCQATFLNALYELKEQADEVGGNAVIGVTSFFKNVTFSSTTEYECHVGSDGVFVWLRGTLAKTQ
jgi:uncharacterized protein YbjQ (UPF0145 family)